MEQDTDTVHRTPYLTGWEGGGGRGGEGEGEGRGAGRGV